MLLLFNLFQNGNSNKVSTELAYSDYVSSVKAGNIREVTISGNSISAAPTSGRHISTISNVFKLYIELAYISKLIKDNT